jgi:hypothetical protein
VGWLELWLTMTRGRVERAAGRREGATPVTRSGSVRSNQAKPIQVSSSPFKPSQGTSRHAKPWVRASCVYGSGGKAASSGGTSGERESRRWTMKHGVASIISPIGCTRRSGKQWTDEPSACAAVSPITSRESLMAYLR